MTKETIPAQEIINATCKALRVSFELLKSPNRGNEAAEARFIIFHLLREYTDLSYPKIAEKFNRDHSTVMYGVETFKTLVEGRNKKFMEKIERVKMINPIAFKSLLQMELELQDLEEEQRSINEQLNQRLTDLGNSVLYKKLTEVLKKKEIIYKNQITRLQYEY
ncbi:Chromosomal replication initiator protein DnaA [Sphingobacterium spiritivorum]|uniref:Chromosomal replication initiator protein DnaA n=1 Tax=Sphingobacterium spiritivorum TaxID=258 RepID=A0A380CS78_SPHSI|nr:helix-turn-helix domain-containing protein [Sphingobacterium spiritivorum]SUJ26383.1 Chromosomal replication initiator protein DnaA [Sphingobacterium spiritivorum]